MITRVASIAPNQLTLTHSLCLLAVMTSHSFGRGRDSMVSILFVSLKAVRDQSWPIVNLGVYVQHRVAAYSIHQAGMSMVRRLRNWWVPMLLQI
jgi:hypothetical protein